MPAKATVRLEDGSTWVSSVAVPGRAADELQGAPPTVFPDCCREIPDATSEQWEAAVQEILRQIAAGEIEKVVLARTLTIESEGLPALEEVTRRFRDLAPSSYVYACDGLVGASPELIVRRRGDDVLSQPMAGTSWAGWASAVSGSTVLAESDKDLWEHQMTIEDVVANLAPWCRSFEVQGPEMMQFAGVTHLVSTFLGRLQRPGSSALALAGALHPTPAVGGRPRARALALIERLEPVPRGTYAGPVGWIDAAGNGDFAVALRCAQVASSAARLFGGAGIVPGSDAMREWTETDAKLSVARRALGLQ